MFETPRFPKTLAAAGLVLTAQAQALVPVTPANIVGTGLMVANCASLHGSGNGMTISEAIDSGLFADGTACNGQALQGAVGSVNSSASRANANAAATAQGQVSMGVMHLGSQLDTTGGNAALFPVAISQGGFGDTLTVNLAGKQGQAGVLQVAVHVSGVLDASGNAGSSAFKVDVTKNDQLMFRDGGSSQTVVWKAASYPVPGPLSEHVVVNETALFSIPITFGTSFELVVLGQSIAATRSQTGGGHSASDFMQTLWWEGVQGVKVGNQQVQGYTLTSASGIDWTQAAVVPEPSAWLLMAAGLGLLAGRRRAAQRRSAD